MILYLDASALVKRYVYEQGTDEILRVIGETAACSRMNLPNLLDSSKPVG